MDRLGQLSNLSELLKIQSESAFDRSRQPESIRSQPRLKQDQIGELVGAYVEGATSTDLGARYGIHTDTVRAHLKRNVVTPRPGRPFKLTEDDTLRAVERHNSGESFRKSHENLVLIGRRYEQRWPGWGPQVSATFRLLGGC